MKKKIIFSMSCIALLSILLSMVLSGVVSYYDSLEIVKKATIAESRYIQNGIALGGTITFPTSAPPGMIQPPRSLCA